MALLKEIETESGITVEYHNATIFKDTVNKTITIHVNSYISKKARDDGKKPAITGKQYFITPETRIMLDETDEEGNQKSYNFIQSLPSNMGVESVVYTYLKTLSEFKDARDA